MQWQWQIEMCVILPSYVFVPHMWRWLLHIQWLPLKHTRVCAHRRRIHIRLSMWIVRWWHWHWHWRLARLRIFTRFGFNHLYWWTRLLLIPTERRKHEICLVSLQTYKYSIVAALTELTCI